MCRESRRWLDVCTRMNMLMGGDLDKRDDTIAKLISLFELESATKRPSSGTKPTYRIFPGGTVKKTR
jgi:hypothetical protein